MNRQARLTVAHHERTLLSRAGRGIESDESPKTFRKNETGDFDRFRNFIQRLVAVSRTLSRLTLEATTVALR